MSENQPGHSQGAPPGQCQTPPHSHAFPCIPTGQELDTEMSQGQSPGSCCQPGGSCCPAFTMYRALPASPYPEHAGRRPFRLGHPQHTWEGPPCSPAPQCQHMFRDTPTHTHVTPRTHMGSSDLPGSHCTPVASARSPCPPEHLCGFPGNPLPLGPELRLCEKERGPHHLL